MRKLTLPLILLIALVSPSSVIAYHAPEDCPPSFSPAPTESPAPSPAPSSTPTDTSSPSDSLSPSEQPTTSLPSMAPTEVPSEVPTESPAPSPSPSSTPTETPSAPPSISSAPSLSFAPTVSAAPSETPTLSNAPTTSAVPSSTPSAAPTAQPTQSRSPSQEPSGTPTGPPSPSPSINPTSAPLFVVASGLEINFEGFDTTMSESDKRLFETTTLYFLNENFEPNSIIDKFNGLSVNTSNQTITSPSRRRLQVDEDLPQDVLEVTFDVQALINTDDREGHDLKAQLQAFLDDEANVYALQDELRQSSGFFEGTIFGSPRANDAGGSSKGRKAGRSGPVVGSLLTVMFAVLLAAMLYVHTRKERRTSMESEKGIESFSASLENGEASTISYGDSDENVFALLRAASTELSNDIESAYILPIESVDTDMPRPPASAMYTPALITMESNIEIPDTPRTNFDASKCTPNNMKRNLLDDTKSLLSATSSEGGTFSYPTKEEASRFSQASKRNCKGRGDSRAYRSRPSSSDEPGNELDADSCLDVVPYPEIRATNDTRTRTKGKPGWATSLGSAFRQKRKEARAAFEKRRNQDNAPMEATNQRIGIDARGPHQETVFASKHEEVETVFPTDDRLQRRKSPYKTIFSRRANQKKSDHSDEDSNCEDEHHGVEVGFLENEDLKASYSLKSLVEQPSTSSITVMNEVAFLHARDKSGYRGAHFPPITHIPRIKRDPSTDQRTPRPVLEPR